MLVLDCTDLVVANLVLDLVETLVGEEALVPELALGICGGMVQSREHPLSKAAVVAVLDIDDCQLLREDDAPPGT